LPAVPQRLLGPAVILRSLILFNLLFAVQTVMDVNYLWCGVALPQGMTYATYAYRGIYPLILTALLSACFVIVAMRPGDAAERSPMIRGLVLLWIGQNVLLMISAILRLDLYVEAYSLTYLRVAAFVWMALVAVGLVLIVARAVFYRSNGWLVRMNAAVFVLTLFSCCFINFPDIVATYNVTHSRDVGGSGERLDVDYLASLGPQVIPALDLYVARLDGFALAPLYTFTKITTLRDSLAASHRAEMTNWRAWNLRGARLLHYLDDHMPRQASRGLRDGT
jgi:hypothetical protein